MAKTSATLDNWREFFRNSNSDIFDIIENGILIAACDYPYDFKLKRDGIAELLFTCKVTKCFGCERIELALPNADGVEKSDDDVYKYKSGIESGESKKICKYSYDDDDDAEAEELTDEIEKESQIFEEISRIQKILDYSEEETLLLDSLRKLQLMPMSVETLKATNIGKSVNSLRKHGAKDIQNLVKRLIDDWKTLLDDWVTAAKAIPPVVEIVTESVKTNVAKEEEEGLPSPPMDEGALFATPTSMELSHFFDGMDDDDRNPQNNRNNVRKPNLAKIPKCKFDESPNDSSTEPKNRKVEPKKNQEAAILKQAAPPCKQKPDVRPKATNKEIMVQKKIDRGTIQKTPITPRPKLDDEASRRMRLEISKRKLQERYQEAQNAKKQRTIQLMEVQDLPKKNVFMQHQRNQTMMKPGNHIKNRANNGRH